MSADGAVLFDGDVGMVFLRSELICGRFYSDLDNFDWTLNVTRASETK